MKRFRTLFPNHPRLTTLFSALTITGLGIYLPILMLKLTAQCYPTLQDMDLFSYYMDAPYLLFWNILPGVFFIWVCYLLTRRVWASYLLTMIPCFALAFGNYYKVLLRSDPVIASDLRLLSEMAGITGNYTLDFTPIVESIWSSALLGLIPCLLCLLLPLWKAPFRWRGLGAALLVLIWIPVMRFGYFSTSVYEKVESNAPINPWSGVEIYLSKGSFFPFLNSVETMFPTPPPGYNKSTAATLLDGFMDVPIPEDKQVNVMGIMLEAFCDLTEFEALSDHEGIAEVYAPWHDLQSQGVSGRLLTNIFAGGTVDSEWTFLTGFSDYEPFRRKTPAYPWYFQENGYQTMGSHPGHEWFYNRNNINSYLGFQDYRFSENYYHELVDPVGAAWYSDQILVNELVKEVKETNAAGKPAFSFSVTYQNHGPYSGEGSANSFITPQGDLTEESCSIINNYLTTLSSTVSAMVNLTEQLEAMEEPTILVLYGDHKPWLGNGNSVYTQLGETFDFSTTRGFYGYYATPYVIWANSAAKAVLGNDFTEEGGDFSPNFLMNRIFQLCGWEGPAFLQYTNQVMKATPLTHRTGRYMEDGELVASLPPEKQAVVDDFLSAQYYRQQEVSPHG